MDPAEVEITVTDDGPLSVRGPFVLVDAEGNRYDVGPRRRVALCRCGRSANKPFCDGAHGREGFAAAGRAPVADGE
ncbi:CDGSH iron-sulfur domain-containing protein [Patulibacter defluvii]|uniref:CDGSH iron-sulfur domain-containing protein n=1 Tax=Patulibacter defluvii TaxID=3095358 RepID=UPI002A7516DC|nr:CDGSH iron-sulfur domain-containing protein [Patulibacter sp. DM4]